MTKLFFIYTNIYNDTLFKLKGLKRPESLSIEGRTYSQEIYKEWYKYNDKVFDYYAKFDFLLPEVWNVYLVSKDLGIIPFSHPFTIPIQDIEKNISVIFHELIHVFLHFNSSIRKDINYLYNNLNQEFKDASSELKDHLIVNIFAGSGMYSILGKEKAEKLIDIQRSWKAGQVDQAWDIIFSQEFAVDFENPIETINKLRNNLAQSQIHFGKTDT